MRDSRDAADAFAKLLDIVLELRVRCPWDRAQTLAGAPRHLIEEAYEVAEAAERGDHSAIAGEIGDLIAQSLLAAVILAEQGGVEPARLLRDASEKLVRRHPHVYAGAHAETVGQAVKNWEDAKEKERKGEAGRNAASIAEVGRGLPATMRAEKMGEKARLAGMDWADIRGVLAKVREELEEVEAALGRGDNDGAADEIGDMMLAIANAPRFIGHNAEQTLSRACIKFAARFDEVARMASERGLDLKSMRSAEIESLWQEAKKTTRPGSRH
jgi:nucleoside triphosphate diphosphatase